MVLGNWQPEGVNIIPQSPPATFLTTPQTAMLSSFIGTNPNGQWDLFLADSVAGRAEHGGELEFGHHHGHGAGAVHPGLDGTGAGGSRPDDSPAEVIGLDASFEILK